MGLNFKEVASLRGNDKKFEENFLKIKWSSGNEIEINKKEESKESEELICYAVLKPDGKIFSYLDKSIGIDLDMYINYYKKNGHKVVKLTGKIEQ